MHTQPLGPRHCPSWKRHSFQITLFVNNSSFPKGAGAAKGKEDGKGGGQHAETEADARGGRTARPEDSPSRTRPGVPAGVAPTHVSAWSLDNPLALAGSCVRSLDLAVGPAVCSQVGSGDTQTRRHCRQRGSRPPGQKKPPDKQPRTVVGVLRERRDFVRKVKTMPRRGDTPGRL